jgi:hypothetical protein
LIFASGGTLPDAKCIREKFVSRLRQGFLLRLKLRRDKTAWQAGEGLVDAELECRRKFEQ